MTITPENLFALLPGVLRLRDAQGGGQLKALVAILAEQGAVLEADIARMYENLFIETCDEWVVPYIGDLIGVRGLQSLGSDSGYSARADVADTLENRRRKGTVPVLETVARDASGWPAHAVEYFSRLGWTQNPNHVRLDNPRTFALRDASNLELVGGPFDPTARTADIRSIALGRGRYNIMNVGIFLWRLQSYAFNAVAHPAVTSSDGRYFFLPAAVNIPLFNPVLAGADGTLNDPSHIVTEIDVPGHLRRRPLYDELEARRQASVDGAPRPQPAWFTDDGAVVRVYTRAAAGAPLVQIPPEAIEIADLSDRSPNNDWRRPSTIAYAPAAGGPSVAWPIAVAVDPVLGRLSLRGGPQPYSVCVSFAYGFPADMGGGPYDRRAWTNAHITRPVDWQIAVSKNPPTSDTSLYVTTLSDALTAWAARPAGQVGVIAIDDVDLAGDVYSDIYRENLAVTIPADSELHIVAAGWPRTTDPGQTTPTWHVGQFEPSGRRPHLVGDVSVTGDPSAGALWLDGLWIDGKITAQAGDLGTLGLSHVTLFPGSGGLGIAGANPRLSVEIVRSLTGAIAGPAPTLSITESIVDAAGAAAISAADAFTSIQRCTIFGTVDVQRLEAGNTIFNDKVTAARRQSGCVRYSFVPAGSATPRRFRCQPDLAVSQAGSAQAASVIARIGPSFTSRAFAGAAYGQLSATTSPEILTGDENESEMGAFGFLMQPQRAQGARAALDEYLRAGLEAGLFFVT